MSEFLHMGGYAFYVWSAFGTFAVVLLWCLIVPMSQRRNLAHELKQRLAMAARREKTE